MTGLELILCGIAALGIVSLFVRARAGVKRAQAAAEIARAGTSPVSLLGRVLVTAAVIACAQWAVITYSNNYTMVWAALGFPALVTAYTVTKALTVVTVNPSRGRTGGRP